MTSMVCLKEVKTTIMTMGETMTKLVETVQSDSFNLKKKVLIAVNHSQGAF